MLQMKDTIENMSLHVSQTYQTLVYYQSKWLMRQQLCLLILDNFFIDFSIFLGTHSEILQTSLYFGNTSPNAFF